MSHLARLFAAVDQLEKTAAALTSAVLEGRDARDEANAVRAALQRVEEAREEGGGLTPPPEHGVQQP